MPKSPLTLKSTVTRRAPAIEPVDQTERQLQAEHHQAAESAALAANEAATAMQAAEAIPKLRTDPHALQSVFLAGCMDKPIVIHLANGVRLSGKLAEFDQYCLLIKSENQQRLLSIWQMALDCPANWRNSTNTAH